MIANVDIDDTDWTIVYSGYDACTIYCEDAFTTTEAASPTATEIGTWPAGFPLCLDKPKQLRTVRAKAVSGTSSVSVAS